MEGVISTTSISHISITSLDVDGGGGSVGIARPDRSDGHGRGRVGDVDDLEGARTHIRHIGIPPLDIDGDRARVGPDRTDRHGRGRIGDVKDLEGAGVVIRNISITSLDIDGVGLEASPDRADCRRRNFPCDVELSDGRGGADADVIKIKIPRCIANRNIGRGGSRAGRRHAV